MVTAANRLTRRVSARATRSVDGAALAAFRMLFGLIAAVGAARFLVNGWLEPMYLDPAYHFTYPGFGWVQPWPGWGMHAHMAVLVGLCVAIALGWHTRVALGAYLLGFTYVELLDRTYYLNHYYWITVAGLVLLLLPSGRVWSLDARRGGRGDEVAAWMIWALRGLVGMVYVYAGIAKLNPDWLRGEPLRIWFPQDADLPLAGHLLTREWVAVTASWVTVGFELLVVPALMWRRTRPVAYAAVVCFHLGTWIVLPQIGAFPFIMIGGALVFFPSDWPRRLLARLGVSRRMRHGRAVVPHRGVAWAVGVIAVVELLLPLRPALYPGDVRWTEEGYRFSWRVMLTEKVGHARFVVEDPDTGRRWTVDPGTFLNAPQERAMSVQPDMVLDAAHILRDRYRARGVAEPRVYADVMVAMNGAPPRRLIDPSTDLASVGWSLAPRDWILRRDATPRAVAARRTPAHLPLAG